MSDEKKWAAAFAYVLFIYATLALVPVPLQVLRSHNLLRVTIASVFLVCLSIILIVMLFRTRNHWRYVAVFSLAAVYGWLTTQVRSPEEQIHFIQYGLVGVLFARALMGRFGRGWRTHAIALALAIAAGVVDELLQGLLPSRHYDVRDIGLDALSATLGLVVFRLIPPAETA